MIKKVFSVGVLLVALVSVIFSGWCYQWLNQPLSTPADGVEYQLEAGASVARVAYEFNRRGILSQPKLFIAYARITGQVSVKQGQYQIPAQATPKQLLQQLVEGRVESYQVTLVEGWTYQQALQRLHAESKLEKVLVAGDWEQNKVRLGVDVAHPEGWFFPDTYQYVQGDSDASVLRRAFAVMTSTLKEQWVGRAQGLPYRSPYEALIMASIVERETGAPSEREQISGVFVRRLDLGMRLQTDPTVIYGMGDRYKGDIRRSDLREHTPYNTYRINGLPPTPIALPGRKAIYAALHPDDSSSIYFVARGDGSHQFSSNLEAHNKAVREYQFRRRSDYRSAPAP